MFDIDTPFSFRLSLGEDPSTGLAVFGFETADMFIFDPFLSECARFDVDPVETYKISKADADGLKQLNAKLDEMTQAAINAACKSLQDTFGLPGDYAGVFFSDHDSEREIRLGVGKYLRYELMMASFKVAD